MKRAIAFVAFAAFTVAGQLQAQESRPPVMAKSAPRAARAGTRETASAQEPRITRAALANIEHEIDHRIQGLNVEDPWDLLGSTRGVYLPGYGVVFTSEINLVVSPMMPFSITITPEQIARMRAKKLSRLPVLKSVIRDTLLDSAAALDDLPANEQVVVGVTLFYRSWENRDGFPQQLVMRASRQMLLDFKANRISKQQLDAAIQVDEL